MHSYSHTNTCIRTTRTFLQFSFHVFHQLAHPGVALHLDCLVTDFHQGFCSACSLQACMKELILRRFIIILADWPLITIRNDTHMLKLKYNGICIHFCNELVTKVVKNLFSQICKEKGQVLQCGILLLYTYLLSIQVWSSNVFRPSDNTCTHSIRMSVESALNLCVPNGVILFGLDML